LGGYFCAGLLMKFVAKTSDPKAFDEAYASCRPFLDELPEERLRRGTR
jgi:hypothetical protein